MSRANNFSLLEQSNTHTHTHTHGAILTDYCYVYSKESESPGTMLSSHIGYEDMPLNCPASTSVLQTSASSTAAEGSVVVSRWGENLAVHNFLLSTTLSGMTRLHF